MNDCRLCSAEATEFGLPSTPAKIPISVWLLSRNRLFSSNRRLAIVDIDVNVDVHMDGQVQITNVGAMHPGGGALISGDRYRRPSSLPGK